MNSRKGHSIIGSDGKTYEVYNLSEFAKEHGLDPNSVGNLVRGQAKMVKGYRLPDSGWIEESESGDNLDARSCPRTNA